MPYTINSDGSIDVDNNVILRGYFDKLPIKFNIINGDFDCASTLLENLEGSPKEVKGDFECNLNMLKTLKGGPKKVR